MASFAHNCALFSWSCCFATIAMAACINVSRPYNRIGPTIKRLPSWRRVLFSRALY